MALLSSFSLTLLLLGVSTIVAQEYGMMIDAGSTGSRICVYSWPSRANPQASWVPPLTEPITQVSRCNKTDPGISAAASDPESVRVTLQPLLDFATRILKNLGANLATSPVYLGATAGMRVLPAAQRDSVMAAVRKLLSNSGFYFEPQYARIISGEEEAAFGYITVNYITGNLLTDQSIGALDLGGASAQLTWAPNTELLANYFPLDLHGKLRALYAHSYLYFGANEAEIQKNEYYAAHPTASRYLDACANSGYTQNYVTKAGQKVLLEGASNYSVCANSVYGLLRRDVPCFTDTCAIGGNYQPVVGKTQHFIAFSAFSSIVQSSLKMPSNASLAQIKAGAMDACSLDWASLIAKYGMNKYLHSLCFTSTYVYTLLHDGYGFGDNDATITFAASMVDPKTKVMTDLGWALGGMLYQTNLLPWTLPPCKQDSKISDDHWTSIVIILAGLCAVLLIALIMALLRFKKQQKDSLIVGGESL